MAFVATQLSRRAATPHEMMWVVIGNATLAALLSRAFGSLVVVPQVTCVMAVSLTSYPLLIDRGRVVVAILVASWLLPIALELAGVLAPTWEVAGGVIRSMSTMVETDSRSTTVLLVATSIAPIIVVGLFANALARSRRDAQRTAEIQAWNVRQLVPPE
jgi:hypothetical protein